MIEKIVDLWSEPCDARCITTNGFVKNNGNLVMGAGVAGQAQARYPWLPKMWGTAVLTRGNHVTYSGFFPGGDTDEPFETLIAFPVKHNWYEEADLTLIERSARELMELIERDGFKKVLLPLPGCGNGKLSWSDVKPVIAPILDDRVWVINNTQTYDFDPPEEGRKIRRD